MKNPASAILIILSGLPGSGKSTIAQALARHLNGVHIRIDTIEQAIHHATGKPAGIAGYSVGYALATDNLNNGTPVIADSVNALSVTRQSWREAANIAVAPYREFEIICSDKKQHRRRVETRQSDVIGLVKPTWSKVVSRKFDLWDRPPTIVDTANRDIQHCVDQILATMCQNSTP